MAADMSSLVRMLRGCEEGEGKRELGTRDLLGKRAVHGSTEVDLELRVPAGRERRLDLESGRTYLQKREAHPSPRRRHCLNLALPPPSMDSFSLDLDVRAPPHSWYQSVCTLDKVRSALDRTGLREDRHPDGSPSLLSSSWSSETSSEKRMAGTDWELEPPPAVTMVVGGCPMCFLYVLVSATAPRCPRCGVHVPVHSEPKKRHKFDLNSLNQEQQLMD